jgi:uncharacterized membrane protein YeaQ/YmgE (transglycosylase-associated protein family)
MSIDIWIIAGLVVGIVASKVIIRSGEGLLRDLGLAVAGAVAAGAIFAALGTAAPVGLDVFGLVVVLAGASAALVAYHTFFPLIRAG